MPVIEEYRNSADAAIFKKIDYVVLKLDLDYLFKPYLQRGKNIIIYGVSGTADVIKKLMFEEKNIMIEYYNKKIQVEYTRFENFKYNLANKFDISFLPIAQLENRTKTKKFFLLKNGQVITKEFNRVIEKKLIIEFDEDTRVEFKKALNKLEGDNK